MMSKRNVRRKAATLHNSVSPNLTLQCIVKRWCGLVLAAASVPLLNTGCAVIYHDRAGNLRAVGIVAVTVQNQTDRDVPVQRVKMSNVGVMAYATGGGKGLSVGFNREEVTQLNPSESLLISASEGPEDDATSPAIE